MHLYKFHPRVFQPPYYPHYQDYVEQRFVIDHYHPEDDLQQLVWLRCTTDPSIELHGYVELANLVVIL